MTLAVIPVYGFVKGKLDNILSNRNDMDIYRYGGKSAYNILLRPQGPFTRRCGTKKILSTSGVLLCMEFAFSDTQTYLFAFKNLSVDIYTADDNVYRATLTTPWGTNDIDSIKTTQSFDTLLLCHPNYPMQKIMRTGSHTSWSIAEFLFQDPPVDRFNTTAILTPSATTGTNITLTLSGTGSNYWTYNHVGRLIRTNEGAVLIKTYQSPTVVYGEVTENLVNTNDDKSWREEAFSAVHGYARVPIFHANRLILCGSRDLPQSFWASKTADIDNFNAEKTDDDYGFTGTLMSGKSETIYDALVKGSGSGANLQLYTRSSEWVIEGEPLTPSTVNAKIQTRIGSVKRTRPIEVESQVIFASADGKSIYDFTFDFGSNSFQNQNLTLLCPSVVNSPKDLTYVRNFGNTQSDLVFLLNSDGTLSVMTINKKKEVLGWAQYNVGGTINCITKASNKLKLFVERDGVQYLEELNETETTIAGDLISLDCYTKLTSITEKNSWGPVSYLSNKTIHAIVNGFIETITIDNSGNFTTQNPATEVIVGYNYNHYWESMPLVYQDNGKEVRGRRIRKIKANINVEETKHLMVDDREVSLRTINDNLLDDGLEVKQYPVEVRLSGFSGEPTIKIGGNLPLPQTVIGCTITLKSGG